MHRSPGLPLVCIVAFLAGCPRGGATPAGSPSAAGSHSPAAIQTSPDGSHSPAAIQTSPDGSHSPAAIQTSPAAEGSRAKEVPEGAEVAILAGGCFWGMEEILRTVPGVLDTEVGYAGGTTPFPTYRDVSTGRTGHAESVRVVFDPAILSFSELLEKWFFRMHDPTTLDRQGNDRGSQYRSAIFTTTPEQQEVAREVILRVDASGKWNQRVVTQVVDATGFTPAEAYHQDYLRKNPGGYTCHYLRD